MALYITHLTSSRLTRRFYIRFSAARGEPGLTLAQMRALLRSQPIEECDWWSDFEWIDGKKGAWQLSGQLWISIVGYFENGEEAHREEEARILAEAQSYNEYASFLEALLALFSRSPREQAAERVRKASAPTVPLVMKTVADYSTQASDFAHIAPIQTVAEAYDVLGLHMGAVTPEQAKKAFLRLAKQWHPDKHPDKQQWAETAFRRLGEAKEIVWKHMGMQ